LRWRYAAHIKGQERVGIGLLVREVFEKLTHAHEGFGDLMMAGQHLIERARFFGNRRDSISW